MSYIRFVWYKVQKQDGAETVHRWALNVSNPSMTLEQYHTEQGFNKIAGPFKTRKEATQ